MDALVVPMAVVASLLAFDALALHFGQDSRSVMDDEWARPWSTGAATHTEG